MRPALITSRRLAAALLVGLAALASPGSARAAFVSADSSINIANTGNVYGGGNFTGTLAVDNNGPTSASVRITLTNTATVASGLYLDSVAFSLPTGATVSSVTLTKSAGLSSNWQVNGGPPAAGNFSNDISTGPFGNLDFGAGIGPTWHTSGTATDGLKPGNVSGSTGTFTFDLVGTGLNAITADALLAALSDNNSAGLAVRYRTTDPNHVGDKVRAKKTLPPPPPPPPGVVPAPPALILALAGVGCLLGRGAFRRKTAPTA